FNEFSRKNLYLLLQQNLHRTTRLNLKGYNMRQLVNLNKIPFAHKNISAGMLQSLILMCNGLVYGSGRFKSCDKNNKITQAPFQNLIGCIQISNGANHSLIMTINGKIYVIGENEYGQLGLGNCNSKYEPILLQQLANIIQVSAGGSFSLVLTIN